MTTLYFLLLVICTVWIDCICSSDHPGHNHKIHKCSNRHDKIIKGENLFQQEIHYKNHPYSTEYQTHTFQSHPDHESSERRSLLYESEVSPLRISAYYDPTSFSTLSSEHQTYIKQLIGAAANYYSKAVRVVPVDGTLFIDRFCTNFWETSFGKVCSNYKSSSCFDVDIPSTHLSEQYLYDDAGTRTLLPGGVGISDTDLIIYVSADDSSDDCSSSSTLAHGGPCVYDQYGRPIAGNINICAHFLDSMQWKSDVNTLLHEMSHITIMNSVLWGEFKDSTGNDIPLEQVLDTTVSPEQIITPVVVSKVQSHFNCATVNGLPLDLYGTSHWNQRYVFTEIMNAEVNSAQMYYSEFTLALMEDSGWYLVNYEYAEPYAFGKDSGCTYFNDDCIDKTSHKSNFPQYYCDSSSDNGCNADHSNPSGCYLSQWSNVPSEYQYFTDTQSGGSEGSNFCPWRLPYSNRAVCWDTTSSDTASFAEIWSSTSRCTEITDPHSGHEYGFCFEHSCYGWNQALSQYSGVHIKVSDKETITCTRSDAFSIKTVQTLLNGELTCPHVDIICGTTSNFGSCYWGHYSDIEDKCVCSPAYTGDDCNDINDAVSVGLTESMNTDDVSTGDVSITVPETVCFEDWDNYDARLNGAWSKTGIYYDLGMYSNSEGKILYFKGVQSAWWIAQNIGSSLYCRCSVSLFTPNIDDCNDNWYCYTGDYTLVSNAKIYSGQCGTVSTSAEETGNGTTFGIVLGVTLGVVLFIAVICCFFMIQKQRKLRNEAILWSQPMMEVEPKGEYVRITNN